MNAILRISTMLLASIVFTHYSELRRHGVELTPWEWAALTAGGATLVGFVIFYILAVRGLRRED